MNTFTNTLGSNGSNLQTQDLINWKSTVNTMRI